MDRLVSTNSKGTNADQQLVKKGPTEKQFVLQHFQVVLRARRLV